MPERAGYLHRTCSGSGMTAPTGNSQAAKQSLPTAFLRPSGTSHHEEHKPLCPMDVRVDRAAVRLRFRGPCAEGSFAARGHPLLLAAGVHQGNTERGRLDHSREVIRARSVAADSYLGNYTIDVNRSEI